MIVCQPAYPTFQFDYPTQLCPKCQTRMRLFGIEYEAPGHELYSYECPKCQRIETAVAKIT